MRGAEALELPCWQGLQPLELPCWQGLQPLELPCLLKFYITPTEKKNETKLTLFFDNVIAPLQA